MKSAIENRYFRIFTLILSCGLVFSLLGQTNPRTKHSELEYVHTNFTTKDGLPSNEVYAVFQDSKGYIWIGTDKGVAKYDGYTFETFTTQDGLTDNTIFDFAEDSKGNIWVTTFNMTLSYYQEGIGFKPYEYNYKIKNAYGFESDETDFAFTAFFDQIDIGENDTLYLSYYTKGYLKIPLHRGKEPEIANYIQKKSGEFCPMLCIIKHENYRKAFIYNSSEIRNQDYINVKVNDGKINQVDADPLYRRYSRPYTLDSNSFFFIGKIINVLSEDSIEIENIDERLHVFKANGGWFVNRVEDEEKGSVYWTENLSDESKWKKIINDKVRLAPSIRDMNGGLWMGTIEQGVFYVPNLNNKILLQDFNLRGILPYKQGAVLYERNDIAYYYENHDVKLLDNNKIIIDSIPKNSASHFIRTSHPFKVKYDETMTFMDGPNHHYLFYGLASRDSNLYLMNRLAVIKSTKAKTYDFMFAVNEIVVSADFIDSTRLVVGTEKGLYISDNKSLFPFLYGNSIWFDYKPKDIKYLPRKEILAVATVGNGLFLFKGNKLYKQLTVDDGLVSNTVNQLLIDANDRLWIGTNKGINYLEIEEGGKIHVHSQFASSRSLISPNVLQMYLYQDSLMLIGTDRGVNEMNINNTKSHTDYQLPIYITNVSVNDTLEFKENLKYNENNIVFRFTAIEYNVYGNIDYRYRLKGLSDQWIYTKERKATFFNLVPNTYEFELEVKNSFGEWVRLEETYTFMVDLPYWKKWWFIGGYVLVILIILGVVLYYYIGNLRKEKELIEDKQLLSEELNESRQMALNSQLNPHFVFNALNSIQNFILTNRKELSSDYLSMFSKLMRFVFENSKNLYVPLFDEIEALRLYLELEQVRRNHLFDYKIDYNQKDIHDVYIPSLLIQPMIENAIWHGLLHKEDGYRLIRVGFKKHKDSLIIEVEDNGVGRGQSRPRPKYIKKQKSSGVELTKQRLSLLSQSTGLPTNFEIKDLLDNNDNPVGTRVIISIPLNLNETFK